MGWYHGMTPEEIEKEFGDGGGGAACPISQAKKVDGDSSSCPTGTCSTATSKGDDSAKIDAEKTPSSTESTNSATSGTKGNTACPLPPSAAPPPPPPDVDFIYHLCQKEKWDQAVKKREPYFPPTYMRDGKFTRASVYKEDIVSVANEYYKDTPGKWIVLEINVQWLYSLGIAILAQDAPESTPKEPVKCLQIFGGISTTLPGLVENVYPVLRKNSDGTFVQLMEPIPPNIDNKAGTKGVNQKLSTETPVAKKNKDAVSDVAVPEQASSKPQVKRNSSQKKGLFGRFVKG